MQFPGYENRTVAPGQLRVAHPKAQSPASSKVQQGTPKEQVQAKKEFEQFKKLGIGSTDAELAQRYHRLSMVGTPEHADLLRRAKTGNINKYEAEILKYQSSMPPMRGTAKDQVEAQKLFKQTKALGIGTAGSADAQQAQRILRASTPGTAEHEEVVRRAQAGGKLSLWESQMLDMEALKNKGSFRTPSTGDNADLSTDAVMAMRAQQTARQRLDILKMFVGGGAR